jgi:hypothetical protein
LKKATARLLTRAVQNSGYVFARAYRIATVREPAPNGFFNSLLELTYALRRRTISDRVD